MNDFRTGLDKMVGECAKNFRGAMEEEHTNVLEGFAASDVEFRTSNYGIATSARKEWNFVVHQQRHLAMEKEEIPRESKDVVQLHENAYKLICACYEERGGTDPVFSGFRPNEMILKEIRLFLEEFIGLRLYTGE
eukprot:SAG31_NODE_11323_length_1042_cov_1.144221_2_plen_135_part_00